MRTRGDCATGRARTRMSGLALAGLVAAGPVCAATVWTNGSGDKTWDRAANWSAGIPDGASLARFPSAAAGSHAVFLALKDSALSLVFETDFQLEGGSLTLESGGVEVAPGATATLFTELRGGAGLTKTGTGTLRLASAASYTGTTRIAAGTLELFALGERLPDASAVVIESGATLRLAGGSFVETIGSLAGGGTVLFGSGAPGGYELRVGADGSASTFSGVLGEAGSVGRLVKLGNGELTLRGDNRLANGLAVQSGDLAITAGHTRTGNVTIAAPARLRVIDAELEFKGLAELAAGGVLALESGGRMTGRGADAVRNTIGGAGSRLISRGSLTVAGEGSSLDLGGGDGAAGEPGGRGGSVEIAGGSATLSDGAALRLAGGRGGHDGAGGELTVTGGQLDFNGGLVLLSGDTAGTVDVTGGRLDFVAGRITIDENIEAAPAALIGANLQVRGSGLMRLLADFANQDGALRVVGGTVDGRGAEGDALADGASGRRLDSTGAMTLSDAGRVLLGGGAGGPAGSTDGRRGGDGGALLLGGALQMIEGAELDISGGVGGRGFASAIEARDGGAGGEGGALHLRGDTHMQVDAAVVSLTGGMGGTGGSGNNGRYSASGNAGTGGELIIDGGALDLLHGATLRLAGGQGGGGLRNPVGLRGGNGGNGGRFELNTGSLLMGDGAMLTLQGGAGGGPDSDGGDGGVLVARGGEVSVIAATLSLRGGEAAPGRSHQPHFPVDVGGPGGRGGDGGTLRIDGAHMGRSFTGADDVRRAVVDEPSFFDVGGADGGAGGTGIHHAGDGGAGGDGGRLELLAGGLHLQRITVELRGGLGGVSPDPLGLAHHGASGAAGTFEQLGGTLTIGAGSEVRLDGRDTRGEGNGLAGGELRLLGGSTDIDFARIVARGGHALGASLPRAEIGGDGGHGGTLVIAGDGRHEVHSTSFRFNGGDGALGFGVRGGSGGAGGTITMRGAALHIGENTFFDFGGGVGGQGDIGDLPLDRVAFGDGGSGGAFTVESGTTLIDHSALLIFDGGDAGIFTGFSLEREEPVNSAGAGGSLDIVGGTTTIADSVLSLRGGRGGRTTRGPTGLLEEGGSGGALRVSGGALSLVAGTIVDLSGGDAVSHSPSTRPIMGGRGGQVLIGGDADTHVEMEGARIILAGGHSLLPGNAPGGTGRAGSFDVTGGNVTLRNGLITGGDTLNFPTNVTVSRATLNVQGGRVDVLTSLELDDAAVHLSGGELNATDIHLGDSDFQFSGGTLRMERYAGALVNAGGTLAVGHTSRSSRIDGGYSQAQGGTLEIDIDGENLFDVLFVEQGGAQLDGQLAVKLGAGYDPLIGSVFAFMLAEHGITGEFASLLFPHMKGKRFLLHQQSDKLLLEVAAVPLPPGAWLFPPALLVLVRRARRAGSPLAKDGARFQA